jgi:hypothetical protein
MHVVFKEVLLQRRRNSRWMDTGGQGLPFLKGQIWAYVNGERNDSAEEERMGVRVGLGGSFGFPVWENKSQSLTGWNNLRAGAHVTLCVQREQEKMGVDADRSGMESWTGSQLLTSIFSVK